MIKIKSITDVITNSSNEVFVYKSSEDPKKILEDLKKLLGKYHPTSGMGGVLEVVRGGDLGDFSYKETYDGILPEDYIIVNIDYGYLEDTTRDYLLRTLGDPLSSKEINLLFLPKYRDQCNKSLEEFLSIQDGDVSDEARKKLNNLIRDVIDLRYCGGKIDLTPYKDKFTPFMNYFKEKADNILESMKSLEEYSNEWDDADCEFRYYKCYVQEIKYLLGDDQN